MFFDQTIYDCLYVNMAEPPVKRRRVELTLDDKIKLIKDADSVPKPTLKVCFPFSRSGWC